jgi:tetratricopeptide (TPR) repeat protein
MITRATNRRPRISIVNIIRSLSFFFISLIFTVSQSLSLSRATDSASSSPSSASNWFSTAKTRNSKKKNRNHHENEDNEDENDRNEMAFEILSNDEDIKCQSCVAVSMQLWLQILNRAELFDRARTGSAKNFQENRTTITKFMEKNQACVTRFKNRKLYSLKTIGDKDEDDNNTTWHLAGPGFEHVQKNPTSDMFTEEVEEKLFELCESTIEERDVVELYKKALREAEEQDMRPMAKFLDFMCFRPGPHNDNNNSQDDAEDKDDEYKKKEKEIMTQHCKGESTVERSQAFTNRSQALAQMLDEIKMRALTDAAENAIDERTGNSNLQVAKRMCLANPPKLKKMTCLFIRLEFANAIPKLVQQLQNVTEHKKKLEHEISQIDQGQNFDYDDEDYDGDGNFEEHLVQAKATRLDRTFNHTLKMATTACESLLEMKPNSASGMHNYAVVKRYAPGGYEEAIKYATKALELHEKNEDKMEGYKFIAEANHHLENHDAAMQNAKLANSVIDSHSTARLFANRLLASLHVAQVFREMTGDTLANAAKIEKEENKHNNEKDGASSSSSKALSVSEIETKKKASDIMSAFVEDLELSSKLLYDVIWEDARREHLIHLGVALYLLEAAKDAALGKFTKQQHDALTEAKQLCLLKPEHMEEYEKILCKDVLVLSARKLLDGTIFALAGDALHMALPYDDENSMIWADMGFAQFMSGELEIAKMCFENAKKFDANFTLPEDISIALEHVGENELLNEPTNDNNNNNNNNNNKEEEEEEHNQSSHHQQEL